MTCQNLASFTFFRTEEIKVLFLVVTTLTLKMGVVAFLQILKITEINCMMA
jgi:hypothetical protein